MAKKPPKKAAIKISELTEENIDLVERETVARVNKTITALEAALATWDAAKEKPEDLEPRFTQYRMFHDALERWEKKALKARGKAEGFERRVDRLKEFVDICYTYAYG